ncbi:MAG: Hsp33 family molecular chaperone HslO [Pseudomonadota bacterium]|nr:MAG: Hsp33 family molecular chaperone HslO [Pseudomonadota bacterium]
MKDTLQRFLFENAAVRGEIVHLDATWQAVLERHDYPAPLRALLGEMMAAVALLAATLKLKGRMIVQLQGSGPVSLLVVEGTSERTLRAIAHYSEQDLQGDLRTLLGDGRLAITLEPREGGERYQGIVDLSGDTLADALTDYLMRSEQLDTSLWLAADAQQAAGLLIQKLPGEKSGADVDLWNRVQHLSATIRSEELLAVPPGEIIRRLYHEEDVRVFEAEPVCFRCSCSRERVANMLRTLGAVEVHEILAEQGAIDVACEFCNQKYNFDVVDAEQLFAAGVSPETPRTHH